MSSMPQESPESLVEAFTSTPQSPGGGGCRTCAHARRKEIDRAIAKFAALKASGETTHSWKAFHRHVLVPSFDYGLSVWSMRRHVTECLGHE